MTRIVLGDEFSGMVQRRRGAIVNTSSGAGHATSPLLAEYSGAKSFIEMFSRGLKAELAGHNIHVQAQAPLFVATKLAKIRKTSSRCQAPQPTPVWQQRGLASKTRSRPGGATRSSSGR